jgi:putative nucleotidyltransferase with HDIG domain
MSISYTRINQISEIVRNHLEEIAEKYPCPEHDAQYRWQHSLRVANYGKLIAQEENANIEVVITACLLHDIAHFESDDDYKSHGRLGAQISRPILEDLVYTPEEIENITYAIAWHVDGNAGYHHDVTLEAKAVSDADNIDRFGAYRIIQWCIDDLKDYTKLIDKLNRRVQRLEEYRQNNPLETETGKALFTKQLDLQICFFKALIEESKITSVPL